MSNHPVLQGIIPPVITPTDAQERVDETGLRNHIRWLLSEGVHGLFIGGSAGEGPLLTIAQWRRMMEITLEEAAGKVPVLGGVMDTSTQRVLERVKMLREIGYRHYVVTPPFYFAIKLSEEHLRLFSACREFAPEMDLIPYNIPPVTQSSIAVETMCEMARRGWARCCKESSGDSAYQKKLLAAAPGAGLTVLMGTELGAADCLFNGAGGLVNVCSNLEPRTYVGLWEATRRGDRDAAARHQRRINDLVNQIVLATPAFLAGPKHLVARRIKSDQGHPLSPMQPLNPEQAREMEAFFDKPF